VEAVSTALYCRAPWDRNAALKASSASLPREGVDEAAGAAAPTIVGSEATCRAISFWNALGRAQRLLARVGAMPEEAAAAAEAAEAAA